MGSCYIEGRSSEMPGSERSHGSSGRVKVKKKVKKKKKRIPSDVVVPDQGSNPLMPPGAGETPGPGESAQAGRLKDEPAEEGAGQATPGGAGAEAGEEKKETCWGAIVNRKRRVWHNCLEILEEWLPPEIVFKIREITYTPDPRWVPLVLDEEVKKRVIRELHLVRRDFYKLERRFRLVDLDKSGEINTEEFLKLLGEREFTPLSDKLFNMIDVDESRTINYSEWVAVCATFCCYTKADIMRFSFESAQIYKREDLDEMEFRKFLSEVEVASASVTAKYWQKILKDVMATEHYQSYQTITWPMFKKVGQKNQVIINPGYKLQYMMWKKTLGYSRWMKIHNMLGRRRRINKHMRTHGGKMPPRKYSDYSLCGCIRRCLFGRHPDDKALLRPWGTDEEEKEALEKFEKGKAVAQPKRKEVEKGITHLRHNSVMEFEAGTLEMYNTRGIEEHLE